MQFVANLNNYKFSIKNQILEIMAEMKIAEAAQKIHLQEKIKNLEKELSMYNSCIIDETGKLHESTKLIHKFEKTDKELHEVFEILSSEF